MKQETLSLKSVVIRHFDSLASIYDQKAENRSAYLGKIDDLVVKHMLNSGIQAPAVLDAGTGTGTRLDHLKQRVPGSKMIACDISSGIVRLAKERNIDGIMVADMSTLPLNENTFDYVFCFFNAFGYIPSEDRRTEALKEFYRVLKPGGIVIIDILNRWHTGEGLSFKKSKKQISKELSVSRASSNLEEGDVHFKLQMNNNTLPGYFHAFTKREADKLFKQSRLITESFQIIGYDSGKVHSDINKGNFLYVLRKPEV